MRVAAKPDGVGVGVVVWEESMAVGVGLAMGCWVEDVDVDLVGGSSGTMSIGVAVVSGHSIWGRELELRYEGPHLVPVRRGGGADGE